jgi:hypothetical protein
LKVSASDTSWSGKLTDPAGRCSKTSLNRVNEGHHEAIVFMVLNLAAVPRPKRKISVRSMFPQADSAGFRYHTPSD